MSSSFILFIFIGEVFALYFLPRLVLQKSYSSLRRIGWSNRVIISIISILYVPGTITHELSHYFVALLFNMNPREISIFPVIEAQKVRLGHVLYEKNKGEFIRPILIGIAPFFGALGTIWFIVYTHQFPGNELWQTVIFGYLILTITANMFSSRQDLVDIGYLLPLGIIGFLLFYLFKITIPFTYITHFFDIITVLIRTIQPPLLFSILFHAILVLVLTVLSKLK